MDPSTKYPRVLTKAHKTHFLGMTEGIHSAAWGIPRTTPQKCGKANTFGLRSVDRFLLPAESKTAEILVRLVPFSGFCGGPKGF